MGNDGNRKLEIKSYTFWDVDKSKLDFNKDKDFIVSRIFERAKLEDVLDTIAYYGIPAIKKILTTNKYLARQGMYLANVLLDIPVNQFAAYAASQHH